MIYTGREGTNNNNNNNPYIYISIYIYIITIKSKRQLLYSMKQQGSIVPAFFGVHFLSLL